MTAAVADRVESHLVELYGIRHHGPGSARSVRAALERFQPDVVLIEAPKEAEAVVGLAAQATPPVALLGYVTDQPERAAFFPFAAFSPEWQAVTWALQHDRPIRCIDLPLAASMAYRGDDGRRGIDPLGQLAVAAGYDDAERWWEDVVEHRSDGPWGAIAEAMTAVRADGPDATGEEALREATMRECLRAALPLGKVAVVCGAFHIPALDLSKYTATADRTLLRGLPKAKVSMTWVPWTHRRLSNVSGYGAGVRSPGWYAHVFEHPGEQGVVRWFANAAAMLRDEDHATSPDHVVAATRLATALAALRGRPVAGLGEVTDAATAVLTEGRPGPLSLIEERLVIGDQLGSVPPDTPMVPLARDLVVEQKRVRLKPEGLDRVLELDLRTTPGLGRSRLLHRLWALGVPWGIPVESRASTGTFRETWRLRWEPELSIRLVEASARGTTIVAAATTCLLESDAATLADLTGLVEVALLADLPEAVGPLVDRLGVRATHDADVTHLIDALGPLARAVRYGDVRASDASSVRRVLDGLVSRICAGLSSACVTLDDDAAGALGDRLTATQSALALIEHPARDTSWPEALLRVTRPEIHGRVAGRATRLLLDGERWALGDVANRMSRALTPGTPAAEGAAFVEGFLAGSGTVLLHDRELLGLLDRWMTGLSAEAFGDIVPLLRRTFGAFEVAERRQLGQLIAGRGDGRPPPAFGWDLDQRRVNQAIDTVRDLLGLAT
jgi:hypothetical protein